jgi:hypothetical protein
VGQWVVARRFLFLNKKPPDGWFFCGVKVIYQIDFVFILIYFNLVPNNCMDENSPVQQPVQPQPNGGAMPPPAPNERLKRRLWKPLPIIIAIILVLLVTGFLFMPKGQKQEAGPETFSGDGVKATLDKTVFHRNEEVHITVEPASGYSVIMRDAADKSAMNSGGIVEGKPGVQKVQTVSYGPDAFIEVWKEAKDGSVAFYSTDGQTEYQPAIKIPIKIVQ